MKFPLIFLTISTALVIQQNAFAQIEMKLRAPIRTWQGDGVCLCPYDQIVTEGISLLFPDDGFVCGELSAYYRTGGAEPACYVGDNDSYGRQQAWEVEQVCRELGSDVCYVDYMNRI